jgi:predicted N-acyltransferase
MEMAGWRNRVVSRALGRLPASLFVRAKGLLLLSAAVFALFQSSGSYRFSFRWARAIDAQGSNKGAQSKTIKMD